jgi:hypothetical protein
MDPSSTQSSKWPEPGRRLRNVKRAGNPLAKAPSILCRLWRPFGSAEAAARLHHESKPVSEGAEMRSASFFLPFAGLCISQHFFRPAIHSVYGPHRVHDNKCFAARLEDGSKRPAIEELHYLNARTCGHASISCKDTAAKAGVQAFRHARVTNAPARSSNCKAAPRLSQRHIPGCVERVGGGVRRGRCFAWLACRFPMHSADHVHKK